MKKILIGIGVLAIAVGIVWASPGMEFTPRECPNRQI